MNEIKLYMEAIILARRNFREYDQIISVYTKESGKKELLARGVKKITSKNAPSLEPFSYVLIDIAPGREIDHLLTAVPINIFPHIRQNLQKSVGAGYLMHVLHALLHEGETDQLLFSMIRSWLLFVGSEAEFRGLLVDAMLMNIFVRLGFSPILEVCVVCDKSFADIVREELRAGQERQTYRPGFFFAGGGLICAACRQSKEAVGESIYDCGLKEISDLSVALKAEWQTIARYPLEERDAEKLHRLIYEFAVYHTERDIGDWVKLLPAMNSNTLN